MLLRVTAVDEDDRIERFTLGELTKASILERLAALYQDTLYRTYAVWVKDGFELRRDAEMLVGGPEMSCESDITGLFRRFVHSAEREEEPVSLYDFVPSIDEAAVNSYLNDRFHWRGTFSLRRRAASMALIFKFDEDRRRKHRIKVGYRGGCCYFEAMVSDWSVVETFSRNKLLRCTWLRNRNVDLVGFLVRPDGCLIARAMHPANSIDFEEFIFTAFVLAVEADRMEYLIKERDEY